MNARAKIWRITFGPDDNVGGAQPTGTVVYENIFTRFETMRRNQMFLQQGIETLGTHSAIIPDVTLDIHERDEYEIQFPANHPYFGQRFRIVNIIRTDFNPNDPRNYIVLEMTQSTRAHGNLYQ